jgi:anti-sigma factor RsiW
MTTLLRRREDLVCQQAVELVTDYLEGALSRKDRNHFEAHLRGCPNCLAYLEQMQATVRAVRALASDDLTPAARTELTELFRRWQSDQD